MLLLIERADAQLRFNFEQPDPFKTWDTSGEITTARRPIPSVALAKSVKGPRGNCWQLTTDGNAGVICKPGQLPGDLAASEKVSVWIHRSTKEARVRPSSTIEFQFYEPDGTTRFWAATELAHVGWRRYQLPLKWFRWSDGRIPQWRRVNRMGIWFRDAAEVCIDEFRLVQGNTSTGAHLTAKDLVPLAFGSRPADEIKSASADGIVVLSDAPELDANLLLSQLQKLQQLIEADFPFLEPATNEIPLLVFAERADYRQFFPRLASRLGAEFSPPDSQGFTMHGISASSWLPTHGTLRPVYVHEFAHALLSARLALPNKNEWLQEGLASHYQLAMHPQRDFGQIVRQSLADCKTFSPLETVCNGQGIPLNRYWQAATVCELLLHDAKYRAHTPKLFAAARESGSTDLGPLLAPVYNVTWKEFRRDWKHHCEKKYAAE